MSSSDYLKSFFSNPIMERYMKHCESVIRYSVTGISASCELLGDDGDDLKPKYIENIINMCRSIMRMAELSAALAGAYSEESGVGDGSALIGVDMFLSDFAQGCREALGGAHDIQTTGRSGAIVNTDRGLLSFFMLFRLRQSLLGHTHARVELSSTIADGLVEITLAVSSDVGTETFAVFTEDDFFTEFSNEISEIFSEKLGAEFEYGDGRLTIKLPEAKIGDMTVLSSDKVRLGGGVFSSYSIMLGDFAKGADDR